MRNIILLSFTALVLSVPRLSWAEESYRLFVEGLVCPFCAYGLERKFQNIEGVESVDVRLSDGVVLLTLIEGADPDEDRARRIIEGAGFTLAGFEYIEQAQ